ncbi:MAG: hypothetical protein Q9159_003746 [Coniocarpon cinnabarinum]
MSSFYQRTKNWLTRNRTPLLITTSLITGGYLLTQYALSKLTEARQRMSDDRIARENLRRRFTQNQEDCTYTVLALLPTATENIVSALEVERLTGELQARRAVRGVAGEGSVKSSDFAPTESVARSEVASPTDQPSAEGVASRDGEGSTTGSEFVHASQLAESTVSPEQQQRQGTSKSKIQLWEEVKIYAITRALTLLYTLALLTLLTRIQLNLLGRRNYLSSVVSLAQPSPASGNQRIEIENRDDADAAQSYGDDFDTNRMYLTFSWWLLHRGWVSIKDEVERAVGEVFSSISPRDNVTYASFSSSIKEVRMRIEGSTEQERGVSKWLPYLLPKRDQEQAVLKESGIAPSAEGYVAGGSGAADYKVTPSLRRLLDETSDIIDSPTFAHVLSETLGAVFELLVEDKVATEAYKIPPQTQSTDQEHPAESFLNQDARIVEVDDSSPVPDRSASQQASHTSCRLATVLAVITRQAHVIGSGGNLGSLMASASPTILDVPGMAPPSNQSLREANEYLAAIEKVRDLEAFAAVVYSSNFEVEALDDDDSSEGRSGLSMKDVEKSLVDVGRDVETGFESAWNRAASMVGASSR